MTLKQCSAYHPQVEFMGQHFHKHEACIATCVLLIKHFLFDRYTTMTFDVFASNLWTSYTWHEQPLYHCQEHLQVPFTKTIQECFF